MKQQRVLVDETQRHEFREPASICLDRAQKKKLVDPMLRGFYVAIHQGRRGANAASVRGANNLFPLGAAEFVARQDEPNIIVKYFGGGARKRVESLISQH